MWTPPCHQVQLILCVFQWVCQGEFNIHSFLVLLMTPGRVYLIKPILFGLTQGHQQKGMKSMCPSFGKECKELCYIHIAFFWNKWEVNIPDVWTRNFEKENHKLYPCLLWWDPLDQWGSHICVMQLGINTYFNTYFTVSPKKEVYTFVELSTQKWSGQIEGRATHCIGAPFFLLVPWLLSTSHKWILSFGGDCIKKFWEIAKRVHWPLNLTMLGL